MWIEFSCVYSDQQNDLITDHTLAAHNRVGLSSSLLSVRLGANNEIAAALMHRLEAFDSVQNSSKISTPCYLESSGYYF